MVEGRHIRDQPIGFSAKDKDEAAFLMSSLTYFISLSSSSHRPRT